MDFQQSKTFTNLQIAYEYELKANTKFGLFGNQAREEVLMEIGEIFDVIARNETFIANRLRNIINGGGTNTEQNIQEAISDENSAETDIYLQFSRVATEEGYTNIAALFNGIANIKLNHILRLQTSLNDIQNNELFCKQQEGVWICMGCGNILTGLCAPAICPICGFPQGYYRLLSYYINQPPQP